MLGLFYCNLSFFGGVGSDIVEDHGNENGMKFGYIMLNWVRIGFHEIYDGYLLAYCILN